LEALETLGFLVELRGLLPLTPHCGDGDRQSRGCAATRVIGSPTGTVDGTDLFPEPGRRVWCACRSYRGDRGVPEPGESHQALDPADAGQERLIGG
jgi:hypothetical protein